MTPETKIGLLIGLGFIIVFAILLSYSTPMHEPGDDLDTVLALRPAGEGPVRAPGSDTVFPDAPLDDVALLPGDALVAGELLRDPGAQRRPRGSSAPSPRS